MLRQTEETIPSRHQHHIVAQVLPLDFQFLHNDDICLKQVEHSVEGALVAPWLIAERIADAIDVPGRDSERRHLCKLVVDATLGGGERGVSRIYAGSWEEQTQ